MKAPVTIALCAIILVVFVFEILTGASPFFGRGGNAMALVSMGAIVPDLFESGEYWRLLSAMFLHIGLLHLVLNAWALYQLGGLFEHLFGTGRFVVVYFATGITASTVSALFTNGIAAGASGAIFGILGALILTIRRSPLWRSDRALRGLLPQLMVWAGINIVIGFSFPGIDNSAHIGGFVSGLLLGLIPHRVPPRPPSGEVIEVEPPR